MNSSLFGDMLIDAVKHNSVAEVKKLIDGGCDVNYADRSIQTPLHMSVKYNRKEILQLLLAMGAIPDKVDSKGRTCLHLAAAKGNREFVELLLAKSNINSQDENYETPLMTAITGEYAAVAKLFVKNPDCDLNLANKEKTTPLMRATHMKHGGLVNLLLESGRVNIDQCDKRGQTALHKAAAKNCLPIVILLTQAGASTKILDNEHKSPVDLATDSAVLEELTSLSKAGSIERTECSKTSPSSTMVLHPTAPPLPVLPSRAAQSTAPPLPPASVAQCAQSIFQAIAENDLDSVKALLPREPIDSRNMDGETFLLFAAKKKSAACVNFLLAKGANVLLTDLKKRNILHLAAIACPKEVFGSIFAHPLLASAMPQLINARDEAMDCPLVVALRNNNLETARLISLHPICDVNLPGKDGITPLMKATSLKQPTLVAALLEIERVAVNQQDHAGQTALHKAAESKLTGIIKILLTRGASKTIRDKAGRLPADVANDSTSKELVLASEEELALATSSVSTSAASSEVRSDALEEDEEPASRLSLSRSSSRLSLSAIDLADGSKKVLSHNEKKFFKAIQEDNVEVIRTLLTTKSFQLSKTYEDGENALLYALRKGKGAVAKFLLDEGADSLAANKRGKNCLHYAARGDFKRELQDALVSSEAITIINDVDEAGETPLVAAIRLGNVQFAKLLVSQETCDVNLADKELISPLMRACIKRHAGMVLLLSDTGRLCFDQVDKNGRTALHYAVSNNALNIVMLLKLNGASTQIADMDRKLPIDYSADPEITAELAEVISAPSEKSEPEPELSLTFLSPTAVPAPQSLVPPNSCAAEVVDGIPALIPDVLDAAAFEALLRQGNNAALFPAELVAAMKDPTASITRDELLEQCAGTDVFLTHDWGIDQFGRDNHMRVLRVNEALKKLGIVTWFDKDRMDGDVIQQMCDGIERTQLVVTFITQRYLQKVNGNSGNDNCRFEFKYALRRKTAENLLAVVMEERCLASEKWTGPVGMALGGSLFLNYVADDHFEALVGEIYATVLRRIKPLLTLPRPAAAISRLSRPLSAAAVPVGSVSPLPTAAGQAPSSRDALASPLGMTASVRPHDWTLPEDALEPLQLSRLSSLSFSSTPLRSADLPEDIEEKALAELTAHEIAAVVLHVLGRHSRGGGETSQAVVEIHLSGDLLTCASHEEELLELAFLSDQLPAAKRRLLLNRLLRYNELGRVVLQPHSCAEDAEHWPLEALGLPQVSQLAMNLLGNNDHGQETVALLLQENVTGECLCFAETEDELMELGVLPANLPKLKRNFFLRKVAHYRQHGVPAADLAASRAGIDVARRVSFVLPSPGHPLRPTRSLGEDDARSRSDSGLSSQLDDGR